ncbi:MAG: type II toxin-antitoxin system HicB family antitoxin [Bacillota bacterium]
MVYPVIIEEDERGGYVVVCPAFEGCYSQGETVEEALANIREAIELCLEELRAEGKDAPSPRKLLVGSVAV